MRSCLFDCKHYKVCEIRKKFNGLNNEFSFLKKGIGIGITDICKYFEDSKDD
jgi:hypothetical protein